MSSDARVRSEAQLTRKRLVDRVKHQENRKKSKVQLERLEAEISQIRQSLELITTQLSRPIPHNHVHNVGALQRYAGIHSGQWPPDSSRPMSIPGQLSPARTRPVTLPSLRMLDCRCGTKHSDSFDSLEQCSVTGLYLTNVVFPQSFHITSNLPRNPPLPSMMLHADGDNFVTSLITPFLRDMKTEGPIETLLGAYLIGYRLMRWQLSPNQSTFSDVPNWLLPTPAQVSQPHPVCVDFILWPKLREFLCSTPETNSMHSIKLYWDSVRVHIPSGCLIFAPDDEGKMSISRAFEEAALDLANWRIGLPWTGLFPHLLSLVG